MARSPQEIFTPDNQRFLVTATREGDALLRNRGGQGLRVVHLFGEQWAVYPQPHLWEVSHEPLMVSLYRQGALNDAVAVWAVCASRAESLAALGSALRRCPMGDKMAAQHLFRRSWSAAGRWHVLYPALPDGRCAVAGFTEPFPGFWPVNAVAAAERGDLSALWPLLGGGA